ncbi:MAG TPA: HlyD family efflux transporter periplasmic adaptor subunit [Burkholderiaceae bacterium]|nr:HlyD family efflux transporter periplasmic adaptor subunit [Burkholderiaceae bacterium]
MTSAARESLLSPDWYRVASMRPRLRDGVRVTRQRLRGETWYVLSDPMTGRHHRFNALAYGLIAACDGQRTLDDVWAERAASDGDDAVTQGEAIRIFSQAFGANLFTGDVAPDAAAIVRAHTRTERKRRRAAINPFAFKLPLWDPDAWLDRHVHRVRGLFGRATLWTLACAAALGVLLLALNAHAVTQATREHFGSGRMLLLMWLAYPAIKALHELAHAFAVKAHGGEVHEIGITLLFMTPVPYVDASASAAFPDKRQRIAVAAAGVMVEVLLATAALTLWLALEPGLLREMAYAVVAVAGLSTLLVNGNPLLRFDGYFVAADALELPNLAQRSNRHWQLWAKRTLLGLSEMRLPGLARGERGWLLAYAPASFVYRGVLLVSLAVVLADVSAWLGLIVLVLAVWSCALKPVVHVATYLWASPELSLQRGRAAIVSMGTLVIAALVAFVVPLPHCTRAPAVVWLPNDAIVRLGSDGFVEQVLVTDGQQVSAGTVLFTLANDPLRVDLERVVADLQRRDVERAALFADAAMRRSVLDDEIARLSAERQRLQQRVDQLTVRAAIDGRVAIDPQLQVVGRYLPQGHVVAHVLPAGAPLVRVLVRNDDITAVTRRPGPIRVALAHGDSGELPARLERATPRAALTVPTAALSEAGGGTIALRPGDNGQSLTAREPFFELDLRLPATAVAHIGARALVTFDHGQASAAELIGLFVRRAFLRHFER